MNMLIIGNGFDLAHERPTTYADFLQFLDYILLARGFLADKTQFEDNLATDINCCAVREYIMSSFDTRRNPGPKTAWNKNTVIQELYECLEKNVWYEYFQSIHKENEIRGKNWIDFEREIREVIEFFDREIEDVYEQVPLSSLQSLRQDIPIKITCFCQRLDFSEYNQINHKSRSYKNTYFDFIEKSYQDLQRLIRCLEIYLDDCVAKIPITCYSPDIKEIEYSSILSFNYTAIPAGIYSLPENPHYIHGRARTSRPAEDNNMVLGVNEYWKGEDKDTRTNFNLYKKFVQRIIKGTGVDYKNALREMNLEYEDFERRRAKISYALPPVNNVYIFGHSLDITDGDILREIIRTPGIITTIFYRNKQQQANQIANLSKVLGQDKLLKYVFSASPTIIFKQQREMEKR